MGRKRITQYVGDGTRTAFSIPTAILNSEKLFVVVGGDDYAGWTIAGTVITFTTAPPSGALVDIFKDNLTGGAGTPLVHQYSPATGQQVVPPASMLALAGSGVGQRRLSRIARTAPKYAASSGNLANATYTDSFNALGVTSFNYVRGIYRNYETTAVTIDAIAFAATNTLVTTPSSRVSPSVGNTLTNDSTTGWVRGGFGGNSGVVIPARISATQCSEVLSDWVKIQSIPPIDNFGTVYPYCMGRTYIPGSVYSMMGYETIRAYDTHELGVRLASTREAIAGSSAGTPLGITTPSTMTRSVNDFAMAMFGMEFMTDLPVLDAIYVGDSRWANQPGSGFDFAAEILRKQGRSVCFSNCSWQGTTSASYAAMGKDRVASLRPAYAFYSVYGANDEGLSTLTQAGADAMFARALDFSAYCDTLGTKCILMFDCPNFNLPLAADNIRKFLTKRVEATGALVCNITSSVGDGNSPEGWKSTMSYDYAHPYYPTGYRALGVALADWCVKNLPMPYVTGL